MHFCPSCDHLLRDADRCCPHCGTCQPKRDLLTSTARAALMGLALGATACMPVAKYGGGDSFGYDSDTASTAVDADADGYPAATDCDDANADIHPDATETPGDGVDSNCNDDDDT